MKGAWTNEITQCGQRVCRGLNPAPFNICSVRCAAFTRKISDSLFSHLLRKSLRSSRNFFCYSAQPPLSEGAAAAAASSLEKWDGGQKRRRGGRGRTSVFQIVRSTLTQLYSPPRHVLKKPRRELRGLTTRSICYKGHQFTCNTTKYIG